MKRINSALFLATVASMALASGASAQTVPTPGPNDGFNRLNGAGATAVQQIVNDEINAIVISDPNFAATYQGTGSGAGRQAWRNTTPQAPVTWNTVQYAFSESNTSSTELTQYNSTVATYGLKPVQLPKFVLPVAFAYNPVYARVGTTDYRFRINPAFAASTTQINGVNVGGLRLTRELYCGIFNGDIRNWKDSRLQTANGGVSLGDANDANWSTNGAPIRLVGRMDRSGTTDIFTRAMKAQCDGVLGAANNKYDVNAEALPYGRVAGAADFSGVRADTPYSTSSSAALAGTLNLIGNQYFNGTTIVAVSGGSASNPAVGSHDGSGLFLMADGSSRVAGAIAATPDVTRGTRVYNGKIGYIGADFISNAVSGNANLHAAALEQSGSGSTTWQLPSAGAASAALGNILPPESSGLGAFANYGTDTRNMILMERKNPLSWYNVLYNRVLPTDPILSDPTAGYPVTGTSQFLGHTCYKTNNLPSIRTWLGYNVGVKGANTAVVDTRFTDSVTGLMAKSNIGALPSAWQRAVIQTFLTNSAEVSNSQPLGGLNLWLAAGGSNHCASVGTLSGATQKGM